MKSDLLLQEGICSGLAQILQDYCLLFLVISITAVTLQRLPIHILSLEIINVPDSKDDHNRHHESHVEYVQEGLMGDQVPAIPLQVFHHAEDAPDQNQDTGSEQGIEVPFPGDPVLDHSGQRGVGGAEPDIAGHADGHEHAEERDLHEEADDDDLLSDVVEIEGPGCLYAASPGLQRERDDVPRHEDAGQVVHGDYR